MEKLSLRTTSYKKIFYKLIFNENNNKTFILKLNNYFAPL